MPTSRADIFPSSRPNLFSLPWKKSSRTIDPKRHSPPQSFRAPRPGRIRTAYAVTPGRICHSRLIFPAASNNFPKQFATHSRGSNDAPLWRKDGPRARKNGGRARRSPKVGRACWLVKPNGSCGPALRSRRCCGPISRRRPRRIMSPSGDRAHSRADFAIFAQATFGRSQAGVDEMLIPSLG